MIRFTLKCPSSHEFESWFPSGDGYASQRAARFVACPTCGSTEVEKSLMAPAIRPARNAPVALPSSPPSHGARPTISVDPREAALAELRRQVQANSDYVGMNFASEARRIHNGEAPARAIYGEAKPDEARQLIEDGVPVAPLPFLPTRKAH